MSEEQARIELLKRYAERVAELGAENARLREALFSIEQSAHPDAPNPGTEYEWATSLVNIARAALKESK